MLCKQTAFHTELFPSLLSSERAFPAIVDSLVHKNSSWGNPPDPQISIVVLGDQYTVHCSSGKEFEDQLNLWQSPKKL